MRLATTAALGFLAVGGRVAHADASWSIDADARYWRDRQVIAVTPPSDNSGPADGVSSGLAFTLGYRLSSSLAVGGRLGSSWEHYDEAYQSSHRFVGYTNSIFPIDLSVALTHQQHDAFVATRVGWRADVGRDSYVISGGQQNGATGASLTIHNGGPMFGATIGYDLVRVGAHRLAVIIDGDVAGQGYAAVGVGIAFHH